ncbi:MAG: hypothetical protein ACOY0T_33705 [Myxococcota bacterium]
MHANWFVRTVPIALVWALSANPAAAALDDANKEAVRALANDARSDYEAGRYQAALEKFQRAYEAARVPKLAVWLARTQVKLGRLVTARELYLESTRLERNALWVSDTQEQAQQEARVELQQLLPRIPRVVLQVDLADASTLVIEIDGVASPFRAGEERWLDPGEHRVLARAGARSVEQRLTLREGEQQTLRLELAPAGPSTSPSSIDSAAPVAAETPASSPARTWGYVGLAAGAVGFAVGAGAGIATAVQHGKLSDRCPNDACDREHWSDVDRYRTFRTVSTVGFVVGAVAATAGVTLLITHPKQRAVVAVWLTPNQAGLQGRF